MDAEEHHDVRIAAKATDRPPEPDFDPQSQHEQGKISDQGGKRDGAHHVDRQLLGGFEVRTSTVTGIMSTAARATKSYHRPRPR